jgi:hypothetical protein
LYILESYLFAGHFLNFTRNPSHSLLLTKVDAQRRSAFQEASTDQIFYCVPQQGVSSELYSKPSVLLPPSTLKGAVPLYNPSQVPQVRITMEEKVGAQVVD